MPMTKAEILQRLTHAQNGSHEEMAKIVRGIVNGETGGLIPAGTQGAHIANASVAHALNSTFSDTEAEAALNALGGKVNSILTVMRSYGILASS